MSRNARVLVAVAGAVMLAPVAARGWVVARVGPRVVGAAAVGVAAGAVAGAAVASSSSYYYPSTTVVTPAPAPAPAPAAPAPAAPPAVGTVVTTLPSGCTESGGRYQCGSLWYQPYFGGNGVYYTVVAP
jgi:hypothetical protein